jgi:methionyl-tRNA formyltransferase
MGWLNLHPAFLPYNRGWHTPSWAILDGTSAGATLHFMDTGVDTGDIVARSEVRVHPEDTANSLYRRLKQEEVRLFKNEWPRIFNETFVRIPQKPNEGTLHRRSDLFEPEVQRLDLDVSQPVGETLRQLRALTTSEHSEASYFESDGRRFRVQLNILPDEHQPD